MGFIFNKIEKKHTQKIFNNMYFINCLSQCHYFPVNRMLCTDVNMQLFMCLCIYTQTQSI